MKTDFLKGKNDLLLSISLGLILVIMIGMSFWFGITGDEPDMNNYGKAILRWFSSFGADDFIFSGDKSFDRDEVIKYYGGLFDFICAIANKISPFEEYTTRHILNAGVGFLAILFSAKICKRIAGNTAAIIVSWLMFLSPFFLGHSMNNPKDIPFATAYIIAIYCIIKLFDKIPKLVWKDYIWPILAIGAAINIRVAGILLIPYLFVFVGILFLHKKFILKETLDLKQYIKPILIVYLGGYLAGSLLWPFALQNPISNPIVALQELSAFPITLAQLWEGGKMMSNDLPNSYLFKSFTITNTFPLLLGILMSIVLLFRVRKEKQFPIALFILFTGIFPLLYIAFSGSNVYHAWRHVLFIFPSLAIMAALAWNWLSDLWANQKVKWAIFGVLAIGLIDPIIFTVSSFPHTSTYYNALVGGVEKAYGNYEVDFYYNSLKDAADWFLENELPKYKEGDSILVRSNASHILQNYFKDEAQIKTDYVRYAELNQNAWDYVIMHIALIPQDDLFTEKWLTEGTIYKSEVKGKTLTAIIKRSSYDDIKGIEYLNQGKADSAIIYLNKYLEKDPNNSTVINMLANALLQDGQLDEALKQAYKAQAIAPTNLESLNAIGLISLERGDPQTAAQMFTNLLSVEQDFIQGYFYLGIAQMQLGQYENALQNLNIASQEPMLKPQSYKFMGDIYLSMGNTEQAQQLYQLSQSGQ